MTFDNLLIERDGAVAVITINRPKVLNALNAATFADLRQALEEIARDADARVLIITGAGEKAFVAGADINELAALSPVLMRDRALAGQQVFDLIEQLGKPVIAAINGYALGGGCELAMACTLRVAADTATLGQPEVKLGILPGYAGTQRLPRLVGKGRAMHMTLTGTSITAAEAERIGLVNRVVPAPDLMTEVRRLAHTLAAQAPVAMRLIIDAINHSDMPLAEGCAYEASLFGLAASTDDMREGMRALSGEARSGLRGSITPRRCVPFKAVSRLAG